MTTSKCVKCGRNSQLIVEANLYTVMCSFCNIKTTPELNEQAAWSQWAALRSNVIMMIADDVISKHRNVWKELADVY